MTDAKTKIAEFVDRVLTNEAWAESGDEVATEVMRILTEAGWRGPSQGDVSPVTDASNRADQGNLSIKIGDREYPITELGGDPIDFGNPTHRELIATMVTGWADYVRAGNQPEAVALSTQDKTERSHVVCICGSMRFMDAMLAVFIDESLAGHIVVPPLVNMKEPDSRWATEAQREQIKTDLDRLHFAKIDLADEVLIVNPGRYVGDSTKREIAYAIEHGKQVRYLVPMGDERNGRG